VQHFKVQHFKFLGLMALCITVKMVQITCANRLIWLRE